MRADPLRRDAAPSAEYCADRLRPDAPLKGKDPSSSSAIAPSSCEFNCFPLASGWTVYSPSRVGPGSLEAYPGASAGVLLSSLMITSSASDAVYLT
jgi:hypothetical protein